MQWRELHPNLWCADEPFVFKGLPLGARMTIVRLSSGELLLISPLHFSVDVQQKLGELGEVKALISPNKFHFLDLSEYAKAYPNAKVYFPPNLQSKEVQPHAVLSEESEALWRDELDQMIFQGNALEKEVIFFHRASRTLILTDLCFNLHGGNWLSRAIGLGNFGPSRLFRLMTRRKNTARASLRRILGWDFDRVIVAHGEVVESGGRELLEQSFGWLLR